MIFTHLWMLWMLPLAAIPILLHLLTLQRLKTIELPTFRFLFDSYIQQRRKLQFLEALLAMLRALFILGFIFVITRPVLTGWEGLFGGAGKGGGREVVLLVDCSASMNRTVDGLTALERAKKAAKQLVERLGAEDQITLVRVAARPTEVFSRFNRDTKGMLEGIDALEQSSSRANLFAAFLQLFGPEAGPRNDPAVYLFTDSQADGWREARSQGLEKLLPEGLELNIVHVGPRKAGNNLAVVGDAPRRNRAMIGLPFLLEPRIVNHGESDAKTVLSIVIDGKQVHSRELSIKAGETTTPVVVYRPTSPGLLKGAFQITKDGDAFPDDDSFLFALDVQPRVKVLVVNGGPSPEALLDEARYAVTALKSKADADSKDEKRVQESIDLVEVQQPQVTPEVLKGASVVMLCNCGALNAAQLGFLQDFVREGGGLMVFPGDKVDNPAVLKAYNEQLFVTPAPRSEKLTDATLTPAVGDPDKGEAFSPLIPVLSHPVLESVFTSKRTPDRDPDFVRVRLYRHFGLMLPKGSRSKPLLYLNERGAPAMLESQMGDGRVIVACFPLHVRWGNLPVNAEFVPLLLRLVGHLEHRAEAEVSPVVVAEGPAEVAVSTAWESARVLVKPPGGGPAEEVPLERQGARLLGTFEKTAKRGYYEVSATGARPGGAASATLGFAVNLAPQESDLKQLDKEGVEKLVPGTVKLSFIDTTGQKQEIQGEIGSRREIWHWLIYILFAVIGAEFMLATMSGRKREGDEGPGLGERLASLGTGAWVGDMTGGGKGERK